MHPVDDAFPGIALLLVVHSPGQPGVMRASALVQVISAKTRPAPPIARAPRCTRWYSPGDAVDVQLYCAIGETTTRFFSVTRAQRVGREHGRHSHAPRLSRLPSITPRGGCAALGRPGGGAANHCS